MIGIGVLLFLAVIMSIVIIVGLEMTRIVVIFSAVLLF
jgi:hypothetical protein